VSRHGIDPSRITVEGRGTSDPIGDNATAEGRLRNRRVVIRLILP
jgi:flagellar motor protein MotB